MHPRIEIKLLIFVVSPEDGDALVVMEQEKKKICFLMKGTTKGERRLGQARYVHVVSQGFMLN